ncbi:hypothetical protein [Cellulomonas bogoriensis]|uniref:Type 4 fimbrial biogenesis protein PilX N-terminal domain-containing protein n=1 Tax=Cellulomonas bogoriensis 69B4 = DSM 16987 TaxID=1386082 RepID=A0A0A0C0W8_9CELL|nr:hypothetical protein [Cellulomonas bogoriensis]KGM14258.1 hypothetical protein N869_00740 [Cellulomonas bogoriensis 69B4 = DSM 16987]
MTDRARRQRTADGDEGIALVTVIAVTAVLAMLIVTATTFAISTQRKAKSDQDWHGALAAAYAGIEEYQSRLANDTSYFVFGNPESEYTQASGSTVRLPDQANPAFGVGEGGPWAEVPGSDGTAHFRYEVDNSDYYTTGTLRVRATGRADGSTRTVVADLRQRGFIEFLYFTQYEIIDPEISGSDPAACNRYRYEGRSTANPPSGCGTINFITADVINGPLHTNDAMQVSGNPTFNGWTTTSWNTTGTRYHGSGSPSFTRMPGNQPAYQAPLGMPQTNAEIKRETRPDIPDLVPRPGCLYTGPTRITFHSDGRVTVHSPWTRFTSPSSGVNNSSCGTPGPTGLGSAGGQTFTPPDNNVMFVQNVPADPTDANYWAPGAPGTPTCLPEDRTSSSGRNAAGNPVGFPLPGEYVANSEVYGCRNGDAFVQGNVNAKLTIAAENYIYVTGDVRYVDSNESILGLVGQNAVYVHNPERQTFSSSSGTAVVETRENQTVAQSRSLTGASWWLIVPSVMSGNNWVCNRTSGSGNSGIYTCERTGTVTSWNFGRSNEILNNSQYVNRRIDAAILSVAHTFMVQNYDRGGNRGTLEINGAIAQKYRGTVGTGSGGAVGTGYGKNYNYDLRFQHVAPPKFLSPVTTTYGVTVWVEVRPVMNVDGSYR